MLKQIKQGDKMKTIKIHQDVVIGLTQIINSINQNKPNKDGSITIGINKFTGQISPVALEVFMKIPTDIIKGGVKATHNKGR